MTHGVGAVRVSVLANAPLCTGVTGAVRNTESPKRVSFAAMSDTTQPQRRADTAPVGHRPDVPRYLVTLPERLLRAAAALAGGAIYETSNVAVPRVLRNTKVYQVTVARLLRIMIEWVGDVRGVYDAETTPVQELAARKFLGNIVEFAGIFAVGWSPLWLLAAASDVIGGSKAYLRALVAELKQTGYLPADADVASYEDLLSRLETGSGVIADAIDVPPLSVGEARASFEALQRQASELPSADDLAELFWQLQSTSQREGRSVSELSAALGLAAARAGLELGNAHIFDFYRGALAAIQEEGLLAFLRRVATPYVARAGRHFHPSASTQTERFLRWLDERRGQSSTQSNP
jgi:predicted DCC family thiol-disulfide oxidoreductase YuxK